MGSMSMSEAPQHDCQATRRPRLFLPPAARLRRGAEFSRIYAEGRRARGRLILVVAAPGLNPETARLGVSVGRKFSKSAVLRNRLRRRLREAFRLERHGLPQLDIVLIPVGRPGDESLAALRDELVTLTGKVARKLGR